MAVKIEEEKSSLLLVLPKVLKEGFQFRCKQQGTTMTKELLDFVNRFVSGEAQSAERTVVVISKEQKQTEAEQLEIAEAIMNAENFCWPVGNLRVVTKDEHLRMKYHPKIRFVDEVGNCYDKELERWDADGSYNSLINTGAGRIRWERGMEPALKAGWVPAEPITWKTAKHLLETLEGMKIQGRPTEKWVGLKIQMQKILAELKEK